MVDSVKTKNFKFALIELPPEQWKRRGWRDASDSCRHVVEVTHNTWDDKLTFEVWSFYNDYTVELPADGYAKYFSYIQFGGNEKRLFRATADFFVGMAELLTKNGLAAKPR